MTKWKSSAGEGVGGGSTDTGNQVLTFGFCSDTRGPGQVTETTDRAKLHRVRARSVALFRFDDHSASLLMSLAA